MASLIGSAALVTLVVGCSAAVSQRTGQTPAPSGPPPSPALSPRIEPTPAGSASAAPAQATASAAAVASRPPALARDTTARVLATDGLLVRSEPGVGDGSRILRPALVKDAELYVWGGPVHASGYDWYEVLPLSARYPRSGWVAAASRSGEPWIAPGKATCPKAPGSFADLRALTAGQALGCFSGVTLRIPAAIVPCNCDIDPAYAWSPKWFEGVSGNEGGQLVLTDRDRIDDPDRGLFLLYLDPSGSYPDPLPIGRPVNVKGMFDHPAARGCTATLNASDEGADLAGICRQMFAVTEITPASE